MIPGKNDGMAQPKRNAGFWERRNEARNRRAAWLAQENPYYAYVMDKKYPDPAMGSETWSKKTALDHNI